MPTLVNDVAKEAAFGQDDVLLASLAADRGGAPVNDRAEADIVVTGNAGCQMQIGAGAKLGQMGVQVCHPIELVDESYARAGFYDDGK